LRRLAIARAHPGGKVAEDPAHHVRFFIVDGALAPDGLAGIVRGLHHIIAVAEPAAGAAPLDAAPKPAVGLGHEVLEEKRVHRALELDVEFADLAFGQRHDHHARELQVLEQGRHIRLVAAHPVERLHHLPDTRGEGGIIRP